MLNGLFVSILFAFSPYHVNLSITYIYVLVWCRMKVVNMLGPRSRLIYCSFAMYWNGSERNKKTHCLLCQHHKRAFASLFGCFQRANTQHNTTEWNISISINIKPYIQIIHFLLFNILRRHFNTFTTQLHIS